MNINQLRSNAAKVTKVFPDGEELTITYRPQAFTPNMRKRLTRLQSVKKATTADELDASTIDADMLFELVTEWNLEADGGIVPLTLASCRELPGDVIEAIFVIINDDVAESLGKVRQS